MSQVSVFNSERSQGYSDPSALPDQQQWWREAEREWHAISVEYQSAASNRLTPQLTTLLINQRRTDSLISPLLACLSLTPPSAPPGRVFCRCEVSSTPICGCSTAWQCEFLIEGLYKSNLPDLGREREKESGRATLIFLHIARLAACLPGPVFHIAHSLLWRLLSGSQASICLGWKQELRKTPFRGIWCLWQTYKPRQRRAREGDVKMDVKMDNKLASDTWKMRRSIRWLFVALPRGNASRQVRWEWPLCLLNAWEC